MMRTPRWRPTPLPRLRLRPGVTPWLRRLGAPASWLRLRRRTARLRLTMLYGCLFLAAGAGLLGFTYWLVSRATRGATLPGNQRVIVDLGCRIPKAVRDRLRHVQALAGGPPHAFTQKPPPGTLIPRDLRLLPARCQRLLQAHTAAVSWVHAVDLHALLIQSAIALAIMAALAIALGWFVAGRMLGPLRAITTTARRISATSLHERLALDGPADEFKELADTLDDLLARLEESFSAQRNFVANASHELRTPLTLDRTLLEVALRDPKATVAHWRSTGRELLASGKQQERLLEALLTLAGSEAGLTSREAVDLAEVAAAALRHYRGELEHRQLHVTAAIEPATVTGEPSLIERLTANLLDNAVRHNVPAGSVEVTTGVRDGFAVLSVASSGPEVPPSEVERLFKPFHRLNTTRSTSSNGHGLGLSIVQAIATAHGATLTADAPPGGGLHVEVSFPAVEFPPRN